MEDKKVLAEITKLTEQEQILYTKVDLSNEDINHLDKMKVELDQCWDLLNQRRALRDAGKNPDEAHLRSANTIEHYEQ
jgi:hypothetical protein